MEASEWIASSLMSLLHRALSPLLWLWPHRGVRALRLGWRSVPCPEGKLWVRGVSQVLTGTWSVFAGIQAKAIPWHGVELQQARWWSDVEEAGGLVVHPREGASFKPWAASMEQHAGRAECTAPCFSSHRVGS